MSMETVEKLRAAGFFGPLDVQLAGLASRMAPGADGALLAACALASRAVNQGHACVDLDVYDGRPWAEILKDSLPAGQEDAGDEGEDQEPAAPVADLGKLPDLETWETALKAPVVGSGSESGKDRTLLVLKGSRLYLRRYRDYERMVEDALKRLNTATGNTLDDEALNRYFDKPDSDEQKKAARKAIEKRLTLLSGGPGTGKTYTLARVVALLAEIKKQGCGDFEVRLVAPTGKAAVRMVESIKDAKKELSESGVGQAILGAIPEEASTIHRLLKARYHSPYFKHDAQAPLVADMVIVDEASMVDLPLMAKLLDALPEKCALMLVGDIAQLASVEPGRVYGDVCRAANKGGPLAGCLSQLTQSHRFPEKSAIGKISKCINQGNDAAAWQMLKDIEKTKDLHLRVMDAGELAHQTQPDEFGNLIKKQMKAFVKEKDPAKVLAIANGFRILCALRKGPCGVARMNRRVEKILAEMGLAPAGRFYDHQLILIRVNTPAHNLFNGDVGVVLEQPGSDGKKEYMAWFPDAKQGARPVPVNLLPDHETAFAMTVHKSQGSEFPCVALVLPNNDQSPILTRELLYTGMTRVVINTEEKTGTLFMWCTESSFKKAVRTPTDRTTGLFT